MRQWLLSFDRGGAPRRRPAETLAETPAATPGRDERSAQHTWVERSRARRGAARL